MKTIRATLQIVVPMFLGDPNQEPTSMRPPSIKGALRFWWRALNWSRCLVQAEGKEPLALRMLHAEEAEIFGASADEKESHGQGVFLLSVSQEPICQPVESQWPGNDGRSSYLAYGLLETNENPRRKAILEKVNGNPNLFGITLLFKPTTSDSKIEQVRQALYVWGLLGGLGGRSRRGFGSIAIISIDEQNTTFSNAEDYKAEILSLLTKGDLSRSYPPYTAFSQLSAMKIWGTSKSSRQAMGELGDAYRNHRGQPSPLRGRVKLAFGLPLQKVDEKNRRASPLFFHIHPIGDTQFVAVGLYLPAKFHHAHHTPNLDNFYAPVKSFVV